MSSRAAVAEEEEEEGVINPNVIISVATISCRRVALLLI